MKYKSGSEENEVNEAKNIFDQERRKSMGIEQAAAQLQKEHMNLAQLLDTLKK